MKRALVSLPDELFDLMRTKLKGKFGQNDSEIIRGIVIAYLSQQGYLKNDEPSEDTAIQEEMLEAVVEVLEERGVATGKDIDAKVKKRMMEKKGLLKMKDLK